MPSQDFFKAKFQNYYEFFSTDIFKLAQNLGHSGEFLGRNTEKRKKASLSGRETVDFTQ